MSNISTLKSSLYAIALDMGIGDDELIEDGMDFVIGQLDGSESEDQIEDMMISTMRELSDAMTVEDEATNSAKEGLNPGADIYAGFEDLSRMEEESGGGGDAGDVTF